MKKLLPILALLVAVHSDAATIRYAATNVFGVADTNAIRIQAVGSPIRADGYFVTRGAPFRLYPNSSGIASTNLEAGNYVVSNVVLRTNILFAVPVDTSTNIYEMADLAISGFNTYNYSPGVRSLTPGGGVGLSATTGNIIITLTNPPSSDLANSTNLPYTGLSVDARTTITNIATGSGAGISAATATNIVDAKFATVAPLTNNDTRAIAFLEGNLSVGDGTGSNSITGNGDQVFIGSGPTGLVINDLTSTIQVPSGVSLIASGDNTVNGTFTGSFTGNGAGMTNLPGATVSNIAALVASPQTNSVLSVQSYWGTNTSDLFSGGGTFVHDSSSTTTNFGTVFGSAYGGRWKRQVNSPNEFRLEWFGVVGSGGGAADLRDETARIQNAIDTMPNRSRIIFPPLNLATTGIVISNRYGLTFEGGNRQHGAATADVISGVPRVSYVGADGGTVVKIVSSGLIVWDGIGVDTETPFNVLTPTNHADIAIDIDQHAANQFTSTDCKILNSAIVCRGTNANWRGVRISDVSASNVEHNEVIGCTFVGGKTGSNWQVNTNNGVAIEIADSFNNFQQTFRHLVWYNCKYGITCAGGSFTLDGNSMSTGALADFYLTYHNGPVRIDGLRSESARQFAVVFGGQGGTSFENCYVDGITETNLASIEVGNSVSLSVQNCAWETDASVKTYGIMTNAYSTSLMSANNWYPQLIYSTNIGFERFGSFSSVGDFSTLSYSPSLDPTGTILNQNVRFDSYPQSTIDYTTSNTVMTWRYIGNATTNSRALIALPAGGKLVGDFVGNGAGITNIAGLNSSSISNLSGIGTNITLVGTNRFQQQNGDGVNLYGGNTNLHIAGDLTLDGGAFAGSGGAITLDASGFNGNLATTDNTVQEVAQKLDDLSIGGASSTFWYTNPAAANSISNAHAVKIAGAVTLGGNVSVGAFQIAGDQNLWNGSYGFRANYGGGQQATAGYDFGQDFPSTRGMKEPSVGNLLFGTNGTFRGWVGATNGYNVYSNSWPFIGTNALANGQLAIGSSNGTFTVVQKNQAGVQTTNQFAAGLANPLTADLNFAGYAATNVGVVTATNWIRTPELLVGNANLTNTYLHWSNGVSTSGFVFAKSNGQLTNGIGEALSVGSVTATTANFNTNNVTWMRATNFFIGSNAISAWPTAPGYYGDAYMGNSNGVIYMLTATNISSLTWTATNRIAP